MIIPSKELLLISSQEKKEIHLFDPKTACVLYTYQTDSTLASSAEYCPSSQQILAAHLNNSFINVYDWDNLEPKKQSIGNEDKITAMKIQGSNSLWMGSASGNLYLYELPSELLIRKFQAHLSRDNAITSIYVDRLGRVITSTKREIKMWEMKDIFDAKKKPVPNKTLNFSTTIVEVEIVRDILCVVNEKNIEFFYVCNLEKFTLNKEISDVAQITSCCSSEGSIFVGDYRGRVKEIPIDAH